MVMVDSNFSIAVGSTLLNLTKGHRDKPFLNVNGGFECTKKSEWVSAVKKYPLLFQTESLANIFLSKTNYSSSFFTVFVK